MEKSQEETIGRRLKKLRKQFDLNLEQAANKINRQLSTLSNWENDKNVPDAEDLIKLSKIYGNVSIDYILTGKEPENKSLYEYKEITEKTLQKIKDLEGSYVTSEVNRIMKELDLKPDNKKKYLLMMRIFYILLFEPKKEQEFYNYWSMLPEDTQDHLLAIDKKILKILNSLLKKNKSEGGAENE